MTCQGRRLLSLQLHKERLHLGVRGLRSLILSRRALSMNSSSACTTAAVTPLPLVCRLWQVDARWPRFSPTGSCAMAVNAVWESSQEGETATSCTCTSCHRLATATLLLHQGKQLSPESMRSFSPDQSHYKTPSRSTLEKETHFFIRQHIEKTRITPKAV